MNAAKQNFLTALQKQIDASKQHTKTLQASYDAVSNLPDTVFEAIYGTISNQETARHNTNTATEDFSEPLEEHGGEFTGNRQIVLSIIKQEGMAIAKKDIAKRFRQLTGKQEKDAMDSVTYALSGLKNANAIKSFNPSSSRNVKVGLWTLPIWWDGDNLMDNYKPNHILAAKLGFKFPK